MATNLHAYSLITGAKLQPINALSITLTGAVDTDIYRMWHVESESSYTITPKIATDGKGRARVLGYLLDATVYLLQNNLTTDGIIPLFESCRHLRSRYPATYTNYTATLYVGDNTIDTGITPAYVQTEGAGFTINLERPEFAINIESSDARSRISVKFSYFTKLLSSIIS